MISVNPNPFNNNIKIFVEAVEDGIVETNLFNAVGKRIHQSKQALLKASSSIEMDDLGQLPDGVYFLQINSGGDSILKKLLKKG